MIQELDPNPFFVSHTKFGSARNPSSASARSLARPLFGTSGDTRVPAGSVVPAYVLRRAGLLDWSPISLTRYRE